MANKDGGADQGGWLERATGRQMQEHTSRPVHHHRELHDIDRAASLLQLLAGLRRNAFTANPVAASLPIAHARNRLAPCMCRKCPAHTAAASMEKYEVSKRIGVGTYIQEHDTG